MIEEKVVVGKDPCNTMRLCSRRRLRTREEEDERLQTGNRTLFSLILNTLGNDKIVKLNCCCLRLDMLTSLPQLISHYRLQNKRKLLNGIKDVILIAEFVQTKHKFQSKPAGSEQFF